MTDDAMVPIAQILGRGEALTVAAMLDAAGIIVHVGGEYYTSVSPDILAVGGFRLTVPVWQYDDASTLLSEMLAQPAPVPNDYTARALRRFGIATAAAIGAFASPYMLLFGLKPLFAVLFTPLLMLQVPVNPQGRGDYYLSAGTA